MHKDPIKLSLLGIGIVMIISIIFLSTTKPLCSCDIDDDKNKRVNWGKMISISLVFGIVTGIIIFLMTMKNIPVVEETIVEDPFSHKVSMVY